MKAMEIKDFELYAERILKQYAPEHLKEIGPLDVEALAHNIGLKIKVLRLSENLEEEPILGMCIFEDQQVEVYHPEIDAFIPEPIEAGTILIDSLTKEIRGYGCYRNTVVHECVHWLKDKDLFLKATGCGAELPDEEIAKIEYEVGHITPRILMPRKTFSKAVKECLESVREVEPDAFRKGGCLSKVPRENCDTYALRELIRLVADQFETSATSTEIRMKELGFYFTKYIRLYRMYL